MTDRRCSNYLEEIWREVGEGSDGSLPLVLAGCLRLLYGLCVEGCVRQNTLSDDCVEELPCLTLYVLIP